jgi:hypothetical protein
VEAGAEAERPKIQAMAERFEPTLESRDAGEGAAPLQRVLRRGGKDGDAQTLTYP